ncbi:hypothetical protein TRVL_04579 [Trypanosoma vivax]|nr:hypothetical protein TRVL_04579 [Trypanosoma vivax]
MSRSTTGELGRMERNTRRSLVGYLTQRVRTRLKCMQGPSAGGLYTERGTRKTSLAQCARRNCPTPKICHRGVNSPRSSQDRCGSTPRSRTPCGGSAASVQCVNTTPICILSPRKKMSLASPTRYECRTPVHVVGNVPCSCPRVKSRSCDIGFGSLIRSSHHSVSIPSEGVSVDSSLKPKQPSLIPLQRNKNRHVTPACIPSLRSVENDEAYHRKDIEELSRLHFQALLDGKEHTGELLRLLRDTAAVLSQVSRFVGIPAEDQSHRHNLNPHHVEYMKSHDSPVSTADMAIALRHTPAMTLANHKQLISPDKHPNEADCQTPASLPPEPQAPYLSPSQHEQQAVRRPSQLPLDASPFVRQPSSLFSFCGNEQPSSHRIQRQRGGFTTASPRVVSSASYCSVEDVQSGTANLAHTPGANLLRDANAALVEDLREEVAYWQEESLRAMGDAELYLQMASLVLGHQLPSCTSGDSEMGTRALPHASTVLTDSHDVSTRVFLQLCCDKEEGVRSKIELQETQARWQLWDVVRDTLAAVSQSRKIHLSSVHPQLKQTLETNNGAYYRASRKKKKDDLPLKHVKVHINSFV